MDDRCGEELVDGELLRHIMGLVEESQRGDAAASEELLRRFRPLLASQVTRTAAILPAAEGGDVWGHAHWSFVSLVREFEAERGVDFAYYVRKKLVWRMANFVRDEMRRLGREVTFPGVRGGSAGDETDFEDVVSDEAAEAAFDHALASLACREALAVLPEREREVMAAVARGEAVSDIAARLRVSSARICQIKQSACRKLRVYWDDVDGEGA